MRRGNKFRNLPTLYAGILYSSKWEAQVAYQLDLLVKAGKIRDLKRQVSFVLMDGFRDKWKQRHAPITYRADFTYYEGNQFVVADAKGIRTDVFNIKYKLFHQRYPDIKFVIFKKGEAWTDQTT
jgi:hypothetical protein